jgi:hypothetical protein
MDMPRIWIGWHDQRNSAARSLIKGLPKRFVPPIAAVSDDGPCTWFTNFIPRCERLFNQCKAETSDPRVYAGRRL